MCFNIAGGFRSGVIDFLETEEPHLRHGPVLKMDPRDHSVRRHDASI